MLRMRATCFLLQIITTDMVQPTDIILMMIYYRLYPFTFSIYFVTYNMIEIHELFNTNIFKIRSQLKNTFIYLSKLFFINICIDHNYFYFYQTT